MQYHKYTLPLPSPVSPLALFSTRTLRAFLRYDVYWFVIGQLPDLPALSGVSTVLSQELGHPSLGQQLERLTPLLQDESAEVWVPFSSDLVCCGSNEGRHVCFLVFRPSKMWGRK